MKLIEMNIDKIIELCRKFHVRKLWVFGSILTNRFRPDSDIDLCVDFDWSNISLLDAADNFFDFQFALEDLMGRKIDLTDDSAVRNRYFRKELNEKRRLIYG
ncbi:MAG: nucleotidyltransferase domain-containing protein [Duncaniella sp.]|nr:nucleotidyltransferase domain-containing protein [Duncaniella sp.]MDE6324774.1 nucleotidyltransferase domain-containing protein [Duncaniella sp.]MDE6497001.1 nucleotidyltransferase domain-containing protein [Duncaniella sp.]